MGGDQTSLAYHKVSVKAVSYPHISLYCALKILSNAVRRDENIKGIKIGETEIKIIQYTDDTTLLMYAESNSLNASIKLFTNFWMISGLKINSEKTEVMRIGGIAKTKHNFRHRNQPKMDRQTYKSP